MLAQSTNIFWKTKKRVYRQKLQELEEEFQELQSRRKVHVLLLI